MIKFKSALDTLQAEIAERERQGIAPVPVQRRGLYKQAPTVTDKQRVTESSVTDITESVTDIQAVTENPVTENGTHTKPIKTKKVKADKADQTIKATCDEIVLALNTHTPGTLETKSAAQRQAEYRKANAEAIKERDRLRKASKRNKSE